MATYREAILACDHEHAAQADQETSTSRKVWREAGGRESRSSVNRHERFQKALQTIFSKPPEQVEQSTVRSNGVPGIEREETSGPPQS